MFVLKILAYLFGYVTLVVSGRTLEKFINLATRRGIYFWDIRRLDADRIMIKARLNGVKPLRHIARDTGSRFKISHRMGLPFLLGQARRRKTLTFGAVFFLVVLYCLSSFVWFVQVDGNVKIADREILRAAREAGLYRGAAKWRFEVFAIEDGIKEKIPEIAWVGLEVTGTRAVITVAEKTLPPPDTGDNPSDIFAAKAGLVRDVMVLSGQAVVQEGDTVFPGQLLVSGEIWPPEALDPGGAILDVEPRLVRARGIVNARVWYEAYGEAPLVEEIHEATGREEKRVTIRVSGREFVISGPRRAPFKTYEVFETVREGPGWRNYALPVEIVTTVYRETKTRLVRHDRPEAVRLAESQAREILKERIPRGAKVLNERVDLVLAGAGEKLVRIQVIVETLEDIGEEKPRSP
ncbi:MAG: sporulation protein YqfD [Candidatus Desulforudis sp.]|nr:sporulation protein YqfD [Desulforudis sp.]